MRQDSERTRVGAHVHLRCCPSDLAYASPGYPLGRDFTKDEYQLRLTRARALMVQANLDALVVTSSAVGQARAALHTELGRRGVLMLTGGTTHRPLLLSHVACSGALIVRRRAFLR